MQHGSRAEKTRPAETAAGHRHARLLCALAAVFAVTLACFAALPQPAFATKYISSSGEAASAADVESESPQEEAQEEEKTYEPMAEGLADGTYIGMGEGFKSTVMVSVEVKDGKIVSVDVLSQADDQEYFDWALPITDDIVKYQSSEVDAISGATYSSRGIKDAVTDALTGAGSHDPATMALMTASQWGLRILAAAGAAGALFFTWRRLRPAKRRRRLADDKWQRLSLQLMFFALVPSAFSSGFMGIKGLLLQVEGGSQITFSTFSALLLVLLAFTVVFGRYFCGYACAFGTFGDVLYQATGFVLKKLKVKRHPIPRAAAKWLGYLKYVVLAAVCIAVLAGAGQFINENSPWSAFSRLSSFTVRGITVVGAVSLGAIALGMMWEKRFFCRFLCPLGAVFSVMPTVKKTGRVSWDRPNCYKGCDACRANCPADIHPTGGVLAGECITCGMCAEACPAGNIALALSRSEAQIEQLIAEKERGLETGKAAAAKAARAETTAVETAARDAEHPDAPAPREDAPTADARSGGDAGAGLAEALRKAIKAGEKRSPVTASHAKWTLAKALLLLAAFWALGIVHFLPRPPF